MSERAQSQTEIPKLEEFADGETITVNGGHHRVTGVGTEGEMNVVSLGDRGDHPHMKLVWPDGGRAMLRVVALDEEYPVEQFAFGEVDTYDYPEEVEARV